MSICESKIKEIVPSEYLQVLLIECANELTELPEFECLKVLSINSAKSLKVVHLGNYLSSLQLYECNCMSITLPSSLTYLDINTESLYNINKLNQCTQLKYLSLYECNKVKTLSLPDNLTKIECCLSHAQLTIPEFKNKVTMFYSNYPNIPKKELEDHGVNVQEVSSRVIKRFSFHNTFIPF